MLSKGYSVNEADQGKIDEVKALLIEAKGTLLAYDRTQLTVRTSDKKFPIRMIQRASVIDLQLAKASDLVTAPTLEWQIVAERVLPIP